MYKEILEKSLVRRGRRPIFPVKKLPEIGNSVTQSTQFFIGQDSWYDKSFSQLQDYDFWIDIDAQSNGNESIQEALVSSLSYCVKVVEALATVHHIPYEKLRIYFSGRRGFHILLPFRLSQPVHPDQLYRVAKQFCQELASTVKPGTSDRAAIDLALYGKRHMIRVPWSLHTSGLRKVPLDAEELDIPVEQFEALIRQRTASFSGAFDWKWLFAKESDDIFSEMLLKRVHAKAPVQDTSLKSLDAQTIRQYIPDARCMAWFANVPHTARTEGFNYLKIFLLSMLRTFNLPKEIALEATKCFTTELSNRKHSPASKLRERLQEVEAAANTIYRSTNKQYDFSVPGRCTALLVKALGRLDVTSTFCATCPKFHREFRPHGSYRVTLKWLLRQKITAEAMRIYLDLVVNGAAPDLSSLAKRTNLSLRKLRRAVKQLVLRKLANVTPAGKAKVVFALRPVQKSSCAKM